MIRLGLCCIFRDQPIRFRSTTATAIARMERSEALEKLSRLCMDNADSLMLALQYCAKSGIGCFRVNSKILPLRTHPEHGYGMDNLPDGPAIVERFRECGRYALKNDLRTSFHPDQFVVLSSPDEKIVDSSLRELEYQAEVAEWIGADVVNIHGGGAYGDKRSALTRFSRALSRLSDRARERITVENDDRTYTPADLLPLCNAEGIPLVYDVHHHRCHRDDLKEDEATQRAMATWNREPLFHISSPLEGWDGPKAHRHHDFIDIRDFPDGWRDLDVTIEVEAKAKELAVLALMKELMSAEMGK